MTNLTCKLYHLWISPFHEMANITYETTAMIWKLKGTIKIENWKRKKEKGQQQQQQQQHDNYRIERRRVVATLLVV